MCRLHKPTTIAMLGIALVTVLLQACSPPEKHHAVVSLKINEKSFDYVTHSAELDKVDKASPYSLYLFRDTNDSGLPYLCLRYYSGNPVAELWLRYSRSEGQDAGLERYECFVPGRLSNGTHTLHWKRSDGSQRNREETGDEGCSASVTRLNDEQLLLTVQAVMRHSRDDDRQESDESGRNLNKVRVTARAEVNL